MYIAQMACNFSNSFFCFSPNTRLQERWNTWQEYAKQLASNMRDLHEKMCSAVFTDMIAHLKIVNEMLNVEVSLYWFKYNRYPLLHLFKNVFSAKK